MGCGGKNGSHSDKGSGEEFSLWYVGVLMSVVASICTNMGVNLQKYSFLCEAKRPLLLKRGYFLQPKWAFGLFLVVFGSIGDFAALGFIPQSLAIPVGGFTIVANVFFAHYFLKEPFSKRDGVGTGLIVLGIMVVAAFASKANDCYTVDELLLLFNQTHFIVYAILVSVTSVGLYLYIRKIRAIAIQYGVGSPMHRAYAKSQSIICPALSGVCGAQSVLFAKAFAELFKSTLAGDNQFTTFGTYAIAFLMLLCVLLQIHWLAQGLETSDAVFVIPIFQCFFISVSILGGAVYFNEFATMSVLQLAMFFLGVTITLGGVLVLSKREMNALSLIQKWRAAAMMVVFLKRTQKRIGHPFTWTAANAPPMLLASTIKASRVVPMGAAAYVDATVLASEPIDSRSNATAKAVPGFRRTKVAAEDGATGSDSVFIGPST
ncbi:hypothetical protein SDRG_10365 [Saprolegnia diclina VS20]|uniref:Magnesium transporter NIPA n=1 Tax=Saprolegnia diclina (strain VS20) TaxID=1156394 RepID=T0QBT6_SAPDV|nr:hypothetical protein SDRG_10365 [Saprolegnia diclina VS20]EQC32171.1 hypothetical protein SDRG_10365 [Saprolegnia diclina VS20]|eukprot:XP_008614573.1 hypothetical protein SDRG_10365 [Saprolegnia diclina VS20]